MKTKEFIEELDAMAYKPGRITTMGGKEIIRIIREGKGIIAIVDEKNEMAIDTKFVGFRSLSSVGKQKLYSLLTEYASTPLEEREEEKEYIYEFPHKITEKTYGREFVDRERFLVRHTKRGVALDGSPRDFAEVTKSFHFTDAEVESYSEDIQALFKACKKELVE